jgi:hypothetical protein
LELFDQLFLGGVGIGGFIHKVLSFGCGGGQWVMA